MEEKLTPGNRRLTLSLEEGLPHKFLAGVKEVAVATHSQGISLSSAHGKPIFDIPSLHCSAEFTAWYKANVRKAKVVGSGTNYVILEALTAATAGYPAIWEGYITGLSHHQYKDVRANIAVGDYLVLKQITDNPYDAQAIAVLALGKQIGWIPKNEKGILPMVLAEHERSSGLLTYVRVLEHNVLNPGDTHYQQCIKIRVMSNYWAWKECSITGKINSKEQFIAEYMQKPFDPPAEPTRLSKEERIKEVIKQDKADFMPGQSNYSGGLFDNHEAKQQAAQFLSKETKMTKLNQIVDTNKTAITTAAQLEAGRIANKYASKLISGKLPLMVRGYADTPVARLLLANTVSFVATNYSEKLGDKAPIVQSVADAMVVSAYSEMLAHFDIDGFIEDFLSSKEMKRVGSLLKADSEEAPRRRRNVNEEGDK